MISIEPNPTSLPAWARATSLPRLHVLRGLIQARNNQQTRSNESFDLATRSAPFEFKTFMIWADVLRRFGSNQKALERLDQALLRTHEPNEDDTLQLKRRLTLIALDRGSEFEGELTRQLGQTPVSGDWSLVAMASAAQKGDFKSAAEFLEKAKGQLSVGAFSDRLKDPLLMQWCYEKELAPYFAPLFRRATASYSDKSRTAAEEQSKVPVENTTAAAPPPGGS